MSVQLLQDHAGRQYVDQPWPLLTTTSDESLPRPVEQMREEFKCFALDPKFIRLVFEVSNGKALYRYVGRDLPQRQVLWELVDGTYEEPAP